MEKKEEKKTRIKETQKPQTSLIPNTFLVKGGGGGGAGCKCGRLEEGGGQAGRGGGLEGGEVEQMNTSDILCIMWSYKNIRLLCYKCFMQVFRLV